MAGIDIDAEMSAFFQTSEFSDEAVLHAPSGDTPIVGNVSVYADRERPGENLNSGASPFLAAAADVTIHRVQFTTAHAAVAHAQADYTLSILTGRHAGEYRIVSCRQSGALMSMALNTI